MRPGPLSTPPGPRRLVMRLLMLASLLPAMMAGEYDNCGRPDAVYATWDQVTRPPRTPPCATTRAECSLPTMPRGQAHGSSYAYAAVESGANIYMLGRACASPSNA